MNRILRIIIFCVLSQASVIASTGTQTANITGRVIDRLTLSNVSLFEALRTLSFEHRVPIGIELTNNWQENIPTKLQLNLTHAKLSDILNMLVQQDPSYRWELNDGVITFIPTRNRDPFLAKFLATKVALFAPENGVNRLQLRSYITHLPEVEALLKKGNVSAFNFGFTSVDRVGFARNIDLRVSDSDVRGILNRIVLESDSKLWVVGWDSKLHDAIYINF